MECVPITVRNSGRTGFYYSWNVNREDYPSTYIKINMKPENGYVKSNSENETQFCVTFARNVKCRSIYAEIKVIILNNIGKN